MSDDEMVALIVSGVVAGFCWWNWYVPAVRVRWVKWRLRGLVLGMPVLCGAGLFAVLRLWASHDVRDSGEYLFFYMVMGAAWTGAGMMMARVLDVQVRDDVLERGNSAAAGQAMGMLAALTLIYAGGNVGDGPGWWVVVFSAGLGSGALVVCWGLLAKLSDMTERITVDRESAAGVRMGGWLVGMGLVLGRAVAGNWISADQTVADFGRKAWPAAVLLAGAIALEHWAGARKMGSAASAVVAAGYVAASLVWCVVLGRP